MKTAPVRTNETAAAKTSLGPTVPPVVLMREEKVTK